MTIPSIITRRVRNQIFSKKRLPVGVSFGLQISALSALFIVGCASTEKLSVGSDDRASTEEQAEISDETVDDVSQIAADELGVKATGSNSGSTIDGGKAAEPDLNSPPATGGTAGANSALSGGLSGSTGNYSEVAVTDIRYNSRKGGGTVIVETSGPATYHTREVPAQNQAVIEIANATLPERLKRPYVTKDFGQGISSITAYQEKGSSTVRVVVLFSSPAKAEVTQVGSELQLRAVDSIVDSDESAMGGEVASTSSGRSSVPVIEGAPTMSRKGSVSADSGEDSDPRILPAMSTDRMATESFKFYGRPISIEVREVPVRDVIHMIAELSGANIVLSGDIEDRKITMKLRQIPWDEALLIVMRSNNLGYVRQGSILRVAPFDSLRKEAESAKQVVDARKAAEPMRVKIIPVGYAKVDELREQVQAFLTPVRGKVTADKRTNSLLVTDTSDVLERVANLVKALDLPPLQVLIEGKVIEARESFSRSLGINWGFTGADVEIGGGRSMSPQFQTGVQIPKSGAVGSLTVGQFDVFGSLTATLGLAESQDQIRVVSSPRVVAVNNEVATIMQSTNIPNVTLATVGASTVQSVTYLPVEMRLEVTPQVTSENDVIMQIKIKREFAGARKEGIPPDINKREANTRALVRNGSTAVIGGIYQSDTDSNETGVPWLRNLPVLGWFFKNRNETNEKNELLVFLTPRIINAETSLQKESEL